MAKSDFPPTALALLVFNRPRLTERVVEQAAAHHAGPVYLIADGPRDDHPEDIALCEEVRAIARKAPWKGPVHEIFSTTNLGLKRRVSTGLDEVFDSEEHVIVLEDDCLPDPSFFPFANELLTRYEDDERVGMISGNNFLWGYRVSKDSYFFSPDVRIWGWATWARVWRDFSDDGLNHTLSREEISELLKTLPSSSRRKSMHKTAEVIDSLDSWAFPFVLHCLRRGYLNVVPENNLVTNIGFGGAATHTGFESFTANVPSQLLSFPLRHPQRVTVPPRLGSREDRAGLLRWVSFPVLHPFDFAGRVWRFLRRNSL